LDDIRYLNEEERFSYFIVIQKYYEWGLSILLHFINLTIFSKHLDLFYAIVNFLPRTYSHRSTSQY